MTAPVITIAGNVVTDEVGNKSMTFKLQTLDLTLINPTVMPQLDMTVTVDAPAWAGTVTAIATREYTDALFVTVTATNDDVAPADTAPFGLSDAPDDSTTFGYRQLELRTTRHEGAIETRGTCEEFEAGLLPGMTFPLTSFLNGLSAEEFPITDVTVNWLNDDTPVYGISFGEEGVTLVGHLREVLHPPPFVPGDIVNEVPGCSGGAYPTTPSQHFDILGSPGTSDAEGLVYYGTGVASFAPNPAAASVWGFPIYDSGGADFAGDCTNSGLYFVLVGPGTLTIQTVAYSPVRPLAYWVYHQQPDTDIIEDTVVTGIDAGTQIVVTVPYHEDADNCVHAVVVKDNGGSCGSKWGWSGADWVSGTVTPRIPLEGQDVTEADTGDGVTDDFTTNYPYQENGLWVSVDGIDVVPTRTSSTTFSLPSAPPTGAQVLMHYLATGGAATGAGNDPTPDSIAVPSPTGHITDTSDAHDASAISVLDTAGHYAATDVEAALAEAAVDRAQGDGRILITSVPAGSPLVFADLLQNSEGTDMLYASEG